ncbi:hypothetical protein HK103_000532 [Boothiomyces macroporosus]|uniref:F-box domain-containing protein n=1 Tax=Boothiomyces macroporosus TaxID=261099 RepID=A0AAD5UBA5_9FUNG|nr:hypothetical protein HK103_000532 [Boothiomyces macroporosus]
MDLQAIPLETKFSLIELLSSQDILTLSCLNKHFNMFLKPFRIISSCMAKGKQAQIWPRLELSYDALNVNRYEQIQKIKKLKECRFVFKEISIEFSLYSRIHDYLPPSKTLKVIENHFTQKNQPIYRDFGSDLSFLLTFSRVTHFSFSGIPICDSNVMCFPFIKRLDALVLENVHLNWPLFFQMLPLLNISELELIDYPLTYDWTNFFNALPKTKIKKLRLTGMVTNLIAVQLGRTLPFTTIEILDLQGNGIGDQGAQAIAEALPYSKITSLDLSFNRLTEHSLTRFSVIIPFSKLLKFDFTQNCFQSDCMHLIYQNLRLTKIKHLALKGIAENSRDALAKNFANRSFEYVKFDFSNVYLNKILRSMLTCSIKELEICGQKDHFGDNGAAILSQCLNSLPLEILTLTDSKIGQFGIQKVFSCLKKTSKLKQLSLTGMALSNATCDIFKWHNRDSNLAKVSFYRTKLSNKGLLNLTHGILNSTIQHVNLGLEGQVISVEGLIYMVCALKNTPIRTISINTKNWWYSVPQKLLKDNINRILAGNKSMACLIETF